MMLKTNFASEEKADLSNAIRKQKKYICDGVARVDAAIGSASSFGALFTPQAISTRGRLRDACEKTIFSCLNAGVSAQVYEDILWRKVYYETYSASKKLRKDNTWSDHESALIWTHLNEGLSYYHQLLHSMSTNNKDREVAFYADFQPVLVLGSENDSTKCNGTSTNSSSKCAVYKECILRTLNCLGDLSRYILDLSKSTLSHGNLLLAVRYYRQYLSMSSESGLIHCNLAHVYSSNTESLMAVLHYLRALTCEKAFESADMNVKKLLEKSQKWLNRTASNTKPKSSSYTNEKFLHTCLCLVSCLMYTTSVEDVAANCQDVLYQLANFLETYDDPESLEQSERARRLQAPSVASNECDKLFLGLNNGQAEEEFSLNPHSMTIICGIFVVCVQRLGKQDSTHTSMAEVFLVSILLTLINHVNRRLEQRISLVDPAGLETLLPQEEKTIKENENNNEKAKDQSPVHNKKSVKKSSRLARLRRRNKFNATESSDDDDSISSDNNSENISESETEDITPLSSSDDDSDYDVKIESDQEWEGLTTWEHLQLISQEGMLAPIYVLCCWLFRTDSVMNVCVKTADSLWTAFARLLNLIRIDIDLLLKDKKFNRRTVIELMKIYESEINVPRKENQMSKFNLADKLKLTPLPEDIVLCTVIPSHISHSDVALNINTIETMLLRLIRVNEFGKLLWKREDCPITTSKDKYIADKSIVVSSDKIKQTTKENQAPKQDLSSESNTSKAITIHNRNNIKSNERGNEVSSKTSESRLLEGMQSLTKQWLQHEVQNLEQRINQKPTLGLYLVPDSSVLIHHLDLMKEILAKPTHMIIIPQAVISSLDQLKKDSTTARDAIRWLEVIFKHGSRFLRSQRSHERTHLQYIKYPKRKDKDAWHWYQIFECCNYLGSQVLHSKKPSNKSTVTLLTGESIPKLAGQCSFSPTGLAHAAGAVLTHVDDFKQKWVSSTKGHS